MKIDLLLFAKLREISGEEKVSLQIPDGATVKDILPLLFQENSLRQQILESVLFAVNQSYAAPDTVLREGDELALIPPVSGG